MEAAVLRSRPGSVNNISQVLLNFTNTGIYLLWSNPSGGVEEAALVSPREQYSRPGFNGSGAYTGFTLGTNLSFSGGVLNTATGGLSGSGTANIFPAVDLGDRARQFTHAR